MPTQLALLWSNVLEMACQSGVNYSSDLVPEQLPVWCKWMHFDYQATTTNYHNPPYSTASMDASGTQLQPAVMNLPGVCWHKLSHTASSWSFAEWFFGFFNSNMNYWHQLSSIIWVGIEETKNHEYQPTERIPETFTESARCLIAQTKWLVCNWVPPVQHILRTVVV